VTKVISQQPARREGWTAATRWRASPALLLAVGTLTALACALRVVGMDQSLFGDEYFTYTIVTGNGLSGVWNQVYEISITPPLHYGLAWLAVQFGGDSIMLVRLPSLVFGTAIVPVVFFLGRRIGGDRVGLLAALLIALSPFAIFYSTEARAYGTLMFLVAVSTFALLRSVDGRGRGWWVVYVLSSCAALWAHYTAVFVLASQAAWALWTHRARVRELLVAQLAVGLGYLPWVPGFLEQRGHDEGIAVISAFSSLTFERVFESPLRTLIGHPFLGLRELPGEVALLGTLALLGLALATAVRGPTALPRLAPLLRSERGLILILALATPVGLLLYDIAGPTLYGTRNLSASLPALVVVVALLLGSLASVGPRAVAALALLIVGAVLVLTAVESVRDDNRRPPYREVARHLDAVAGGDPVVEAPLDPSLDERLGRSALDFYAGREHPVYRLGGNDAAVWRRVRAGASAYQVLPLPMRDALADSLGRLEEVPEGLLERQARLGGPDGRAILRESKTFEGLIDVSLLRYRGAVDGRLEPLGGREFISWTFGRRVIVSPGVARGSVEGVSPPNESFRVVGWALAARRPKLPDWVLCFSRDRLLAVSPGGGLRRDLASTYGPSALLAGFSFSSSEPPPDSSSIRVFAVVGKRASELPLKVAAHG
jgi:mannosyltransferase